MARILFLLWCNCFFALYSSAQISSDSSSITISGVVFSTDNVVALPYVSIYINHLSRGTISDSFGYFSLNAQPRDTLFFSAVGYKTAQFVIPDYLVGQQYSMVQGLVRDTVLLEEVTVYSLPTTSEFMESFSDNDLGFERRISNMKTEIETVLEEDIILGKYQPIDINDGVSRLYNAQWGVVPPNNFLNPMRWSQFVKDLRQQKKVNRKR